jgi:MFS family permease
MVRAMVGAQNRRVLFAGLLGSSLASQIQNVAIGWHVFSLAHRPLDLGLVGLALFLPTFAFALPAGVFADRHDRRFVVAGAQAVEALCVVALVAAVLNHVTALAAYLAILAVIGTANAFGTPAMRSVLPSIVEPDDYLRVQATYSSLRQIIVIVGPGVGGLLVAISTPVALGAAAVCELATACFILALTIRRDTSREPPRLRDALGGLQYIRSRPVVLGAISLDLFAVLFGGATALLPAFADGIFHVGPQGLGALRSAPAVGAAIVAALIARRPIERNVGPTLLVAVTIFGVATIAFGLSTNFIFSLAMLAVLGGADMISVVIRSGLVQMGTPDAMRGRVSAVENVFIGASNELGEFESGTLAAFIGVVGSVVAGGIGTLAVIAVWALFFPALRNADRFDLSSRPERDLSR